MKHINKNPETLIINVEFPAYGSPSSLPLVATVYNIDKGLWMCHSDPTTGAPIYTYPGPPALPVYAWSSLDPGTVILPGPYGGGSWPYGAPGTGYEAYEVPVAEMNSALGIFGDGKYWINLTAAHNSLDRNDGSVIYATDCVALPNWDASVLPSGALAPPGPGFAGLKGYLIRISNASHASGMLMPTPPIYIHLTVDQADVNVVEWLGAPVTASPAGFPDVNVHEYNAAAVNPTTAGVPDVNVIEVMANTNAADGLEDFAVNGYDIVNNEIIKVNTTTTTENIDAGGIATVSFVNGAITADKIANDAITADKIAAGAIHTDNSSAAGPAIAAGAIHTQALANEAIHADTIKGGAIHAGNTISPGVPAIAGGAIHTGNTTLFIEPALSGGAIHAGTSATSPAIAPGAIHKDNSGAGLPAIEAAAIHADALADDAIHANTIKGSAIHAGVGTSGPAIAPGAIHAGVTNSYAPAIAEGAIHKDNAETGNELPAIAEDAISEGSIAIGSVTYEEISDSAVREIVSGIWNASVLSPIGTAPFDESELEMAAPGTMGHAMLVDYISKNMVHIAEGDPHLWATPMHMTLTADPNGEKFYSTHFDKAPLAPEEIKSYIDRTAVLFRGLTVHSGDIPIPIRLDLHEYDSHGDGWNGCTFKVWDASMTEVASETLENWGFGIDTFYLTSGETYSWTLSAAGPSSWPSEVGFDLVNTVTNQVLGSAIAGDLDHVNPIDGNFDLEGMDPTTHQQHLVRIVDVDTDAGGQFFKIRLVDEAQSIIPGGIIPTKTDPGGPNENGLPGDILIVKAETDATMHEIAHEVWEEDVKDHETPDTFGMLNRIMAGLSQFNHQITDSTYDESGRLLACRLVVYSNSEDARNGENPLTTIEVTSAYDEKQNMTTFVAAEEN